MSKREDRLLIEDILDSAKKISDYSSDLTLTTFLQDSKTLDAVIRNFEIIGEASSRLSEDFKQAHPNIDWVRIRGFRNRIVHDYFEHRLFHSLENYKGISAFRCCRYGNGQGF